MKTSKTTRTVLALLLMLLTGLTSHAENIFEDSPVGTYIITDYQNRKIKLKIDKPTSHAYLLTKGPGTITINGKTLRGTWFQMDNDPCFRFETYDNIKISYSLPSGTAKIDQIVISQNGKASYNTSAMTDGDWIKVKRAATPKRTPRKKSK